MVKTAFLHNTKRSAAISLLLLLLATAVGCHKPAAVAASATSTVQGLKATLEDEVQDLPEGRIRWSTYWQLCWDAAPAAVAYELQAATAEGNARQVRRVTEHCFRLQAAAGENKRAQGLLNRALQLALQAGQLAYRVRAVHQDGSRTEWSRPLAVGKVSSH